MQLRLSRKKNRRPRPESVGVGQLPYAYSLGLAPLVPLLQCILSNVGDMLDCWRLRVFWER